MSRQVHTQVRLACVALLLLLTGFCCVPLPNLQPNPGNWVLSFDNSYSYMRAKTVYFTVTNGS